MPGAVLRCTITGHDPDVSPEPDLRRLHGIRAGPLALVGAGVPAGSRRHVVAVRRALRAHQHHVIEQPLTGLEIAPGRPYRWTITLDAASGVAEWRVDGHLVHDVRGVEIP